MRAMQKMLLSVEKIKGMRTISHKRAGYNKKGESTMDPPHWSGREDSNLRPSEPHSSSPISLGAIKCRQRPHVRVKWPHRMPFCAAPYHQISPSSPAHFTSFLHAGARLLAEATGDSRGIAPRSRIGDHPLQAVRIGLYLLPPTQRGG